MIINNRKTVSAILSKMDKDGRSAEAEVAPESGEHNEYTALAEDLMTASKSGSVHGIAAVLKKFHQMIAEDDEEQDA